MSFPQTPRDIYAELFVNNAWTDITGDVRQGEGIAISRGRKDETSKAQPSTCQLTLDNRSSNYCPRNPTGTYYGSIGRNTPLRLGIGAGVNDTFTRTVSNGWGTSTSGHVWTTTIGLGGSILASDWNVASGVGTHSVPSTVAYRISHLATTSYKDIDVRVDVTLPFTDVLGAAVEPANILLRGQSSTNYYMVRVTITAAEAVTISLMHFDGTVIAAATTVSGLTHSSSQALRVRMQAEGHTLRAKVWAASASEPYEWHVSGADDTITTAGWIGVRSGVATGNTNTKPIVFSYDNWVVRIPRFTGEVASWPQRWDTSGNDIYVPIEAAGVTRRLGQGAPALQSSLRRGLLSDTITTPVAYWPCEEEARANRIASGLPGGNPMIINLGTPQFGASDVFDCSNPLPYPKDSYWSGRVPTHTVVDRVQVRFLLSMPAAGITEQSLIAIGTSGSIATWLVLVDASGNLKLKAFSLAGVLLLDTGYFAYAVNGSPLWMSIEYEQVGANVEANLVTLRPGAATGSQLTFTSIASQTVGITQYVQIGSVGDVGIGHVSVHREWSSLFDLGDELAAWTGETAGARVQRLCDVEGIPLSPVGDLSQTAAMGPQRPDSLLNLLQECADADLGTLHEPKGEIGIAYRTRASVYNQPVILDLDYTAGEISPPFESVEDDQLTRNDVTAKRTEGSEARSVVESGRMSVLSPADGGIGRYDSSVTVNVEMDDQLADIAGWLTHLGTVDEERYPTIKVELARPTVVAAGLESAVLALNIDDRLTVSNPKAGQSPDQISQLARGYAETLNTFEHTLAINCSPESPYEVLELDDAESRLDSDTSTLASGVNSSATSLSVAIADGTLWTTSAGEMPIAILIGGEEMSVTAISGASSPQTFTVTRSVNGVIKSHSTGAEVRVAYPAVLAL